MLKFAIGNLISRPARSFLSLLGLTVAIIGMVGLFSVAGGIDAMVSDTFGRIPGLIAMQRGAPIPLFSRVPRAWRDDIEKVPGIHVVSAEIWVRVNLINEKSIISPPRFFFGADIKSHQKLKFGIYESAVIEGRYLNDSDKGLGNALVSKQIASEFEVGVGDSIMVNGAPINIVGIYHCGSLLLDVAIVVDQEFVRAISRFDPETVCSFYIEPTGDIPNDVIAKNIQKIFRDRKIATWQPSSLLFSQDTSNPLSQFQTGNPIVDAVLTANRLLHRSTGTPLADPKPRAVQTKPKPSKLPAGNAAKSDSSSDGPLEIRSAADWAERFDEFSEDLDIFLAIMTSIGLTIAVLSIINTMLMSVSERIIEFGILKANGWSGKDVMTLITLESATLGFCGGCLGAGVGWLLTLVVNWQWPDQIRLEASVGLLSFSMCFATALGIVGGLYPAIWATRMMPIDAIRRG
jgi:putative ABC transport system permease protein